MTERAPNPPRFIFPVLGLGAIALGVALLLVLRMIEPGHAHALPTIATVPEFSLKDQTGAPFTRATLTQNDVWVADFIFTRCQASCPALTGQMRKLQGRVGKGVHFVSFTVDPENDTPEVLAGYASKVPAEADRWSFVTGDAARVRETIVKGFKMSAQRVELGAGEYDIEHGNWFVLGDGAGRVRGFYHVDTDDELDALAKDVELLSRGGARG